MAKVTKESLAWRIARLEHQKRIIGLSIKDVYNLEAYKMLLDYIRAEEHEQQMREEYERGRL